MFNQNVINNIRNQRYLYYINRAMRPNASTEDIRLGQYFYNLAKAWFNNNGKFFKNAI
nr:MAG TPA: hypothetical protein [Caudoviricetes sp.]DAX36903.1 MAG TPA: hypothetical protein [Caudoviricetes sp.]